MPVKRFAGFGLITLILSCPQAPDESRVRTAVLHGMEVPYEVIDGLAIYAGDIILGTADEVAAWNGWNGGRSAVRRAAPSGYLPDGLTPCIWPDGIIPYVIDQNISSRDRETILSGIRTWDTQTVLDFVERTSQHEDYLRIVPSGLVSGTWLCDGDSPGEHIWQVERNVNPEVVLHGIGHVIGLEHEQQRRDRDDWVTVFSDNIATTPYARDAWHPRPGFGRDIGPYDYRSIMTYVPFDRGKQRNHARPFMMETIPPGMPFGGEALGELSPGDIDSVARLYGHVPTEHVISTNPAGLDIIVDGERKTAPASFRWEPGSEHTLAVPSPQFLPGSRFLFGRWSNDGDRVQRITASPETTLYQASFIAQYQISTTVEPPGAGSVVLTPSSPGGYYTLRLPVEVSATAEPGSNYRFLRWAVRGNHWWSWYWIHMHGEASNPASTRAGPGLAYRASFVEGPIFRIDSNVDPVPVTVAGHDHRTPVAFRADRFSGSTSVTPRLIESHGRAYRHRFRSWSDGGDISHRVDVPQDADTTLTLTLETEYRLGTHAWADWWNEVLTTPSSEDGFYPAGTEVRLLARGKPPAEFVGWSGDVAGSDPAALVVMDDGKLAEAVFAHESTELRNDVPTQVALRQQGWSGLRWDLDFERFHLLVPSNTSELEIRFDTQSLTPGAEAGLWVVDQYLGPGWVGSHETADLILRDGVARATVRRPSDGWPAAYTVLIRAAASRMTRRLEGTLLASVKRYGDGNRLVGRQLLEPGQFIQAGNVPCRLLFQTDGNLVAYKNRVAYWSTHTSGTVGGAAVMQSDGNFVVRDAQGVARWSTRTRSPGAYLSIQNDCNVILRAAGGAALWTTGRP